jgi:hypothetical protein
MVYRLSEVLRQYTCSKVAVKLTNVKTCGGVIVGKGLKVNVAFHSLKGAGNVGESRAMTILLQPVSFNLRLIITRKP